MSPVIIKNGKKVHLPYKGSKMAEMAKEMAKKRKHG